MELQRIVKDVQGKNPLATVDQIQEAIKEMELIAEQIAPNMIGEIADRIKAKSDKSIVPKSHQLTRSQPSQPPQQIERSTSKPITRAQKFELQQANQIDLKIEDSSDDRKTSAMDSIRFEADRIDSEMTSIESQQARDLVDEVLPQFAQWRANQSPDRVAQHIEDYGKEVAEDLLPKFRNYSQALGTELREVAASALGELTKA